MLMFLVSALMELFEVSTITGQLTGILGKRRFSTAMVAAPLQRLIALRQLIRKLCEGLRGCLTLPVSHTSAGVVLPINRENNYFGMWAA